MKPGSFNMKPGYRLALFSCLLMTVMLAACGTLQVDLAPTPGSTPRPGVPITPTPWFGPAQFETEAGVIFDDRLKLHGYTVKQDSNKPASRVTVTLIWEVLDKIDADYNTFVHLFNEEDQLLAQSDRPTGGGYRKSPDWIVKEYVYDQHHLQLPGSMSLDDVKIRMGLYDFNDGRRLDVESPNTYALQVPAPSPGRPPANVATPKITETSQSEDPNNKVASPPPDEPVPDVTPGPTVTPQVDVTAAVPVPDEFELRVAYVKDANVWIWDAESGSQQLTLRGGVEDVWLSDDGQYIAFMHNGNIWAVKSDGENARQLTHEDDFPVVSPDPETGPIVTGIRPAHVAWRPSSHQLYFSTAPQMEGPGLFLSDDLWMVDVDSGELSMALAPGDGGNFYFSPDGRSLAIVTPGRIDLMEPDGSNRREAFNHTPVITYSEFEYYAQPVWAADSGSLRVTIPPTDFLAPAIQPTSIWYIPVEDQPARLIGEITTHSGGQQPPFFAPDFSRLAYLVGDQPENREVNNQIGIGISEMSESIIWDPVVYEEEIRNTHGWSPDGLRFLVTIPTANVAEIVMGQPGIKPLISGQDSSVLNLTWTDNNRFLYVQHSEDVWHLLLGHADRNESDLIDSGARTIVPYDFTWVPMEME